MILPITPDAPLLIQAGAAGLLILHIGGAAVGIVSGWVAILARKGRRLHRVAGDVFCVAMIVMAVVGGAVAPFMPSAQWSNTTAAAFTLYLVATSWMVVRRRPGEIGLFEPTASVVAIALAAMAVAGLMGLRLFGGGADPSIYVFGGLAALAAACDLRMIAVGGVAGPARVARHLWRISLALVLATASYFLGQPKFVPAPIRGTVLAALPVLAALGLLVFWMVRVRFAKAPSIGSARASMPCSELRSAELGS